MIATQSEFGGKSGDAVRFSVLTSDVRGTERGARVFGRTAYSARTTFGDSSAIGGARRLRGMKGGLMKAGVRVVSTGGVRPVAAERGLPGFVHAATPRPQGAAGACPWSRPA